MAFGALRASMVPISSADLTTSPPHVTNSQPCPPTWTGFPLPAVTLRADIGQSRDFCSGRLSPAPSTHADGLPRTSTAPFLPAHKAPTCKSQTWRQRARPPTALFAAWLLLAHCGCHSLARHFRTPPPARENTSQSAITLHVDNLHALASSPRGQRSAKPILDLVQFTGGFSSPVALILRAKKQTILSFVGRDMVSAPGCGLTKNKSVQPTPPRKCLSQHPTAAPTQSAESTRRRRAGALTRRG